MDIERFGKKRTRRTRTWASVCVGLFGDREGATDEPPDDAQETASSAD